MSPGLDISILSQVYDAWRLSNHDAVEMTLLPLDQHSSEQAAKSIANALLNSFKLSIDEVQYLGGLKDHDGFARYPESFINYLQRIKFMVDVKIDSTNNTSKIHKGMLKLIGPYPTCLLARFILRQHFK